MSDLDAAFREIEERAKGSAQAVIDVIGEAWAAEANAEKPRGVHDVWWEPESGFRGYLCVPQLTWLLHLGAKAHNIPYSFGIDHEGHPGTARQHARWGNPFGSADVKGRHSYGAFHPGFKGNFFLWNAFNSPRVQNAIKNAKALIFLQKGARG